jgi:hypothetical protein
VSKEALDLWVNVLGLVGVALLSWPALYAARLARLAVKLRTMRPIDDTQDARDIHDRVKSDLEDLRAGWSDGLNFCLLAGTGLTVLSYLVGVLKFFVK